MTTPYPHGCAVEGCNNALQCRYPSDPSCARAWPPCNAWLYPDSPSWDVRRPTRDDGRQCLLRGNHSGPHAAEVVTAEAVNHPSHYGGGDNVYETIKVLKAWGLGFLLGNAVKYISRAGKKDPAKLAEDLKKARWYLDEAIKCIENKEPLF